MKSNKAKKKKLVKEYGCYCQICGQEKKFEELAVEHVIAKRKGGGNAFDNLSLACRSCNSKKATTNTSEMSRKRVINDPTFFSNLVDYERKNGVFNVYGTLLNLAKIKRDLLVEVEMINVLIKEVGGINEI